MLEARLWPAVLVLSLRLELIETSVEHALDVLVFIRRGGTPLPHTSSNRPRPCRHGSMPGMGP